MITANNIISFLSSLAPEKYSLDWDNSGLQVGEPDQEIKKVLVCLDVTKEVLREARQKDCGLIVSHHPLIFEPLKKISARESKGQLIMEAIKNDVVIYAAHTNLDLAPGGLNDYLARRLNLSEVSTFIRLKEEQYYKLVVFVPISHFEQVRKEILDQGAGHIGNYSHASFSVKGQGSFKPLAGSDPYQGQKQEFTEVQEYRLETIVAGSELAKIKEKLLAVHPYEEVALDVYPLENNKQYLGPGRIGQLPKKMTAREFLSLLRKEISPNGLKYTGDLEQNVKTVALCTGSGGDYVGQATASGADLYLTGDVKYHQALEAQERGLILIDAGHYGTEQIVRELLADELSQQFSQLEVITCKTHTNPWEYE